MKAIFVKIRRVIKNPLHIVPAFGMRGMLHWLPDEIYLRLCYHALIGAPLDLKDPKGYNEKIQWLKLYDRKPSYTARVDKYEAKRIAESIIGSQYIVPCLGHYAAWSDIPFSQLPEQFVIKVTHNSCGVFICKGKTAGKYFAKDGTPVSLIAVAREVKKMLRMNYYYDGREWPYKDVKPQILIDKYLPGEIQDYKLMCFNGKVKILYVEAGRSSNITCDFYDTEFNRLDMAQENPQSTIQREKPAFLNELIALAEKLSVGIPTVRIDFFENDGKLYFAEYTFFNWAGFVQFVPATWDEILGSWLVLPSATKDKE